ncbi:MAG: carbohydrate ABC transporter permease [Spirochaetales bacterium]|nr:carbohydrate ABC transporter permease [Spirochaetales bacterium]
MTVKQIKRKIPTLIMLLISVIYLVPIWLILVNSFKSVSEANLLGIGLPENFKLHYENYIIVFQEGGIVRAFFNGVLEAACSSLIIILFSSLAAFIIGRRQNRITNIVYYIFICGLIIPPAFVPTYMSLRLMNLLDTYTGLILIFTAYGLPISIFLYTGFLKTISRQLDESAFLEGCSPIRIFYQIIFPLLTPVTTTIFIFCFVGAWNDVMIPMFFVNGDKWALPLTLYKFKGTYGTRWNLVFADIVITILPLFTLFVFAQRYMIDGLTAGAVKG